MCEEAQSTSKQTNKLLDDTIDDLLEDFAEELENDEKTETQQMNAPQTEDKIESLKNCTFKEEYYRVYRTMCENKAKPFIFHEIRDVHLQKVKGNTRLVGVYTYEPDESCHYLSNYNVFGVKIENPSKVVLDMSNLEKFPVVSSCVEILGSVRQKKDSISVVVYFFHDIEEEFVEEYLELYRKQTQLFSSLSENFEN